MDDPLNAYQSAKRVSPPMQARPYICLSYAQSIDGSIALKRSEPFRISGEGSMVLTHNLRAANDGILVGIGTILADDPQLTVRYGEVTNPKPIILDTQLRTPISSRVVNGPNPPWIATCQTSEDKKAQELLARNVRIFSYPADPSQHIPLQLFLADLVLEGINTLMVEGGAEIIQGFLRSGYVDWIMITIGPMFLGGYSALGTNGINLLDSPIRLTNVGHMRAGDDLIIWGQPELRAP